MSVAVPLALAVVTVGGEAWAKNWNLSEGQESKDFNKIDLSAYDEFRTLSFIIDGQTYDSHAAYRQGKNLFGFYAKGILFYEDEVCDWNSNITNRTTKTGSFEVRCPSGFSVDGRYTYVGNRQGSYGSGTDSKGRAVSYKLGAEGSSNRALIEKFNYNAKSGLSNQPPSQTASTQGTSNQSTSNGSLLAGVESYSDSEVCDIATVKYTGKERAWISGQYLTSYVWAGAAKFLQEAKRRGLSCGVSETTKTASAPVPKINPKVTSAALTAAEKEAERLRQELAALKAQQQQRQQTISSDTQKPTIKVAGTAMNGPQGTIKGFVRDNTGVAEVRVDGRPVEVDSYGNFTANTYVPEGGVSVSIQAIDLAGLSSSMSVRLERSASTSTASISFDRLNPLGRKVAKNNDALALIIGVDAYENTPARAIYADSDAKVFADYASQKLGIPTNRIRTLVNDGADESGMLLAVKEWLSRASKQGKSDVYVFFAGHGLASPDGEKMYLLPYDGSPRLLEKTAILRDERFSDIAAGNPRSVTVFLDTCYSGETRGKEMLIAGRPIGIRVLEQSVPDNFTLMTAAAGDQIANPLREAKHGMFSYFLMKGMEGEADKNSDNKITAGELHEYVQRNVVQQSSGSQTPDLLGDANRVLVQFQ